MNFPFNEISYNTVDSTWNFENDMSNAQRHIKKFEEDAKEQDLDLSDPNSTILLWEAVEAGFR